MPAGFCWAWFQPLAVRRTPSAPKQPRKGSAEIRGGFSYRVKALLSFGGPGSRHVNIGSIESADRRTAKQTNGTLNIRPQNLQSPDDSCVASGRESVGVGAPQKNRARSQAECFHNISTATDSSIHEHLDLVFYGGDDFRKCTQGRINRIELPASVVRHHYGGCAYIHGTPGTVARQKACYYDGPRPRLANPS